MNEFNDNVFGKNPFEGIEDKIKSICNVPPMSIESQPSYNDLKTAGVPDHLILGVTPLPKGFPMEIRPIAEEERFLMTFPALKFAKIRDVKSPSRAHKFDAGIDFFVPNDFLMTTLGPGESIKIPIGIKVDVPRGYMLTVANKSGVASKKRLTFLAHVIDHGYEGEVIINLVNVGNQVVTIDPGEKIVQCIMIPIGLGNVNEVSEEDLYPKKSERGEGGFGSTDKEKK